MNTKAPGTGTRSLVDPSSGRAAPVRDREEDGSNSLLSGPQSRRSGYEAHAALTGDLHEVLGNTVVRAALTGMDSGPGTIVEGALTLGAAGMQVADSTAGLFTNQFMQSQLAAHAPTPTVAAAASALSRHGGGESFSDEAGKRVDVALKRGGRPLPDDLRSKMEAAFGGADFSRVRIHTDGAATAAARGIHAHAFAVGENVYFGTGEFRPHSREGQELLAHELTHVVQAQEGRIRAGDSSGGQAGDVAVSSPTDSHEREAVAMAAQVVGSLGSVSAEPSSLESAGRNATEPLVSADGGVSDEAAASSEMGTAPVGSKSATHEGSETRNAPEQQALSRDAKGPIGRKTDAAVPTTTGRSLPTQTAAALGSQLGSAIRQVRVHDGSQAAQFAQALNAKAVTVGQDIYFNRGFYRPGTTSGDELIAHEAHHAVIGGGGPGVSQPGDAHEREAVAFGEAFIASGGTQALSKVGLEAPTEALSSQINDRLAAVPRGGLDAVDVDAELATGAINAGDVQLAIQGAGVDSSTTGLSGGPSTESGTATASGGLLGITPVDSAMGSSESFSRDALTGTAHGETDTTSGTEETLADTYTELVIAGKVYRVKVPPSTGQTATANTDLDAYPCEGLHLTGATVNIDAEGKVVGGTVRGALTVPGLFNGTEVAMAILPGGTVAPAVSGLPIKIGPATGTMDLSITEAGLAGEGTVSAAEMAFPSWLGLRAGEFTVGVAAGKVNGRGTLDGTPSDLGVARIESVLEGETLVSQITYILNENLTPVPWLTIHSGVLTGTLLTDLSAGAAGGDSASDGPTIEAASGGATAADPTATSDASTSSISSDTSATSTSTSGGDTSTPGPVSTAAATPDFGDFQVMPVTSMGSVADGPGRSAGGSGGSQSRSSSGTGGLTIGDASGQDPNTLVLRGKSTVSAKDWIKGEVDMALDPAGRTFDISGVLTSDKERKFGELLSVKTKLGLTVRQNQLIEATGDVSFKGPKYDGEIVGAYDIQNNTLNGKAKVRLTHHWPIEGSWGEIRMLRHGKLEADVVDNQLGDIHGRLRFDGLLNGGAEGPLDFEGYLEGKFDPEKESFTGVANGESSAEYLLPGSGPAQGLALEKGAQIRASVQGTEIETVKMDAAVRYDREGSPFLQGRLSGAVYDISDGTVSGKGTLTLKRDLERSTSDGKWTIRIAKGTNVDATVKKNELDSFGGDIIVQVDDAKGKLGQGKLGNATIDIDTWETSGELSLTTARKFFHPEEGQLMANGYGLTVLPGTGLKASIKKDVLSDVGGVFKMMVRDKEGSLARLTLDASLDLQTEQVSGTGTISLARGFTVAEDLGGQGWSAKILRGTKGTGHVEQGVFTKVSGEFKSQVDDEEGKFLRLDGTGEWTTSDQMFSIVGKINVEREKVLVDGGEGGWSLALLPGESAANGIIEKNVFKGIEGTINTMVRRAGADFASVKLAGTWKESEGFKGEGAADLLLDMDVATIGAYHLSVVKGSGATVAVDSDEIDKLGGKVPMRLDDSGEKFIEGKVEGEYQIEEKQLDGTGTARVLVEKHLGTMGEDQLWLIPSEKATVTIKENQLTEVGGEMNLSVRNGEGEYARITLEGSFDAAAGTGFSGKGAVTVMKDRELYASNGYAFWLTKGGGATAHIKENQLEKIDGKVPFMVRDANPAPLLRGSVDGTYDPTTGQISGGGEVYLGRTVEYDLGGGVQLKLLAGSGGKAEVDESKLERLGGTLKAEIWKDGEGYINMTAVGEYDVLSNTLTRLSGTAKLLKPLQLLDGQVEVSNIQGTATIENNELVEVGGRGDLVIHPLNDMKGWFDLRWSTSGGVDTYEGTGNVEFTLLDKDPQTGRGMGGEVGVTAKSDGTFSAVGEVDYAINEILGGKLQVDVDQTWDPKFYGTMVLDANLVEARDLFKLEKDLVPEQTVNLPYGLALFYGMRGGMGMALDALRMQAAITVGNWNPLRDGSVPQFESNLDLTWGMNFRAMVAPYFAIGGDLGFASAQMGVRGEVELNAPVKASAGGFLKGQGGGFYGELSVGVGIAPTIDLDVIPYIKGEIPGFFEFEEDLDRFEQPLGTLFKFEWGSTYGFGDTEYQHQAPIQPMSIPAPTHKETKHEGRPDLGIGNGGGGQNKKGGPQLESGAEIAGNQTVGEGQMAEVMATLNDVIAVIEGLGAAGELFGMLTSAMAALATFGPPGLVVHIVWGIYTGDLDWTKIKDAVCKVVKALQAAGRLLRKHFPDWWNLVVDSFSGETPGLLEALYGADDRMREAVYRGDHKYAPYDMQVQMVQTMKDGWVSTADAICIALVFESAAERGWLGRMVDHLGGGNEFIDGWFSFFDDRAIRSVFDRNGIAY